MSGGPRNRARPVAKAAEPRREHRSASQIVQYQRCGAQYEMQRVKGLQRSSSVPAIRGLGVHGAVAMNFEQKVESRRDLPLRDVVDAAVETVDGLFANEPVYLTNEEATVGIGPLRDRTRDLAARMARRYHLEVAPHRQPIMVEERITIRPDPDVLPSDVVVVLDHADADDVVRDIKTKEKPPRDGDQHVDQQLTLQAMAFRVATGRMPKGVAFEVVQAAASPRSHVRFTELTSTRTVEDFAAMTATLRSVDANIRAGRFPPTDPRNWWCSEAWCSYWHVCPFVAGQRARGRGGVR